MSVVCSFRWKPGPTRAMIFYRFLRFSYMQLFNLVVLGSDLTAEDPSGKDQVTVHVPSFLPVKGKWIFVPCSYE
jgi:hypothetical protein